MFPSEQDLIAEPGIVADDAPFKRLWVSALGILRLWLLWSSCFAAWHLFAIQLCRSACYLIRTWMAFGSSRGCRLPTTIDLHHVCVERRARPRARHLTAAKLLCYCYT